MFSNPSSRSPRKLSFVPLGSPGYQEQNPCLTGRPSFVFRAQGLRALTACSLTATGPRTKSPLSSASVSCEKQMSWCRDFPSGPVIKNSLSSARDMSLISGQGTKIPHALGQLSLNSATTESACSGAHTPPLERIPCTITREIHPSTAMKSMHARMKTQSSQNKNK